MTNEAVERLRRAEHDDYAEVEWAELIDAALAAERKAAVERIRAAVDRRISRHGNAYFAVQGALDAEAAR